LKKDFLPTSRRAVIQRAVSLQTLLPRPYPERLTFGADSELFQPSFQQTGINQINIPQKQRIMAPPSATATETVTAKAPVAVEVETDGSTVRDGEMPVSGFPHPPVFTDKLKEREYLKGRLAAAFRIFGKNGYDEGVAGHITIRDPVDPETFWVNPFGVAFSHINASDLLHVDHAGKVINGGKVRLLNTAAYMIRERRLCLKLKANRSLGLIARETDSAVHAARPDVACAAHSHSIYGRTFCTLGRELDITTQDSCAFYKVRSVFSPPWQ
jgi:hypothetical protein